LRRQHLLEPAPATGLLDVVSDNVAIHAQLASAAELQLRARVEGVDAAAVRRAVADRRLIKTWAMRGTLHLVTAGDLPLVVAALGTRVRYDSAAWLRAFKVTREEMESFLSQLPDALAEDALTREELVDAMAERVPPRFAEQLRSGWGTLLKPAAFLGLLCFGPSQGQRVTFVRPDRWVRGWKPSPLAAEEALAEMARRYLHRYGPATHAEFARWWGTDPAHGKRVFRSIEDELAVVEVDGERVWARRDDVDALAATETVGSASEPHVRLLPNFDPYVLFFHPRGRLVAAEHRDRVFRKSAWISPVVLVDGLVAGVWEPERKKAGIEVTVEAFGRLAAPVKAAIEREAAAVGAFEGSAASVRYGTVRGVSSTGSAA
jgi:hypothetical protein